MKKIYTLIFIVLAAVFVASPSVLAEDLPSPTGAGATTSDFDPYNGLCEQAKTNNDDGNSATDDTPSVCNPSTTNPVSGQDSLIMKATNIISAVAGVIAVIMLMYNGVKIMLSNGDAAKFEKARTSLIFLAVGIAIIVLARTIIAFILGRIQ